MEHAELVFLFLVFALLAFKYIASSVFIISDLNKISKRYYDKHASKNPFIRSLFWNFRKNISTVDFIINFLFFVLVIIDSVVCLLSIFKVFPDTPIVEKVLTGLAFISALYPLLIKSYRRFMRFVEIVFKIK